MASLSPKKLQFVCVVCNILSGSIEASCVPSMRVVGDDGWVLVVSELNEINRKRTKSVLHSVFQSNDILTFRQSWKTAKPTEMTNEKNDNCKALNALMPNTPRINGTRVMIFNKTNVKIGTATFFNFDFLDSLGALLNLTLKSISSFCKFRDEIVTLLSATGTSNETSLR